MCVRAYAHCGEKRKEEEKRDGSVSEHVFSPFSTDLFVNTFANFFVCVSILFPCVYMSVFVYEGVSCVKMCGVLCALLFNRVMSICACR